MTKQNKRDYLIKKDAVEMTNTNAKMNQKHKMKIVRWHPKRKVEQSKAQWKIEATQP